MTHNHELPPGGQPNAGVTAPGNLHHAEPARERGRDTGSEVLEGAPPFELELRGLVVSIRAVTSEDEAAILEFLSALPLDSRRLRFFATGVDLRAEPHRGAARDDADHHGVLAIAPERGVVGHAICVGFAAETLARRDEVDVEFPTSNWPGAQAGFRL